MGLLADGESWLRAQRRAQAGTVSYSRGGTTNASVKATQAETTGETDGGDIILDAHVADWLIDRADLTLASAEVEPMPGDQITIALAHGDEVYEVASIGPEPCWRWHGRDGGTYRIHTVRV
jgi:hypothetical protein